MLKISRITPCEYNKSCSARHHESNKIGFAFFWIFYDFLEILQVSANSVYYWRIILRLGPWKELDSHRYAPSSRIKPWKGLGLRNWVPGSSGRRSSGQRRRTGGAPGRGKCQGGLRAHLGRVGARRLGGKSPTAAYGDGRLRRLGLRQNSGRGNSMSGHRSSRVT
jgi:hypothetical protein